MAKSAKARRKANARRKDRRALEKATNAQETATNAQETVKTTWVEKLKQFDLRLREKMQPLGFEIQDKMKQLKLESAKESEPEARHKAKTKYKDALETLYTVIDEKTGRLELQSSKFESESELVQSETIQKAETEVFQTVSAFVEYMDQEMEQLRLGSTKESEPEAKHKAEAEINNTVETLPEKFQKLGLELDENMDQEMETKKAKAKAEPKAKVKQQAKAEPKAKAEPEAKAEHNPTPAQDEGAHDEGSHNEGAQVPSEKAKEHMDRERQSLEFNLEGTHTWVTIVALAADGSELSMKARKKILLHEERGELDRLLAILWSLDLDHGLRARVCEALQAKLGDIETTS